MIDPQSEHDCCIDTLRSRICLRPDLSTDQLMYVLPRAALITALGTGIDCSGIRGMPLRVIGA